MQNTCTISFDAWLHRRPVEHLGEILRGSRSGRGGGRSRVECDLLRASEVVVGSSLLSANTHQVEVIQIVGDDDVHAVNIALSTHLICIKDVHCGAEARDTLGQSVVLGGLPVTDEDVVSRRLWFLDRSHPLKNSSLEGEGCVLLNVFWMVQQVHLQKVANVTIIEVPKFRSRTKRRVRIYLPMKWKPCNYILECKRFSLVIQKLGSALPFTNEQSCPKCRKIFI